MVRWAEKPSLREASCCSVEVVKGGGGVRRAGFFSTDVTLKLAAPAAALAACADASWPRSNLVSRLPACLTSRARNGSPPAETSASTDQYSWVRNASISISRSTIRRSATDCTRPAEREPGNLRHSTGERLKPTR